MRRRLTFAPQAVRYGVSVAPRAIRRGLARLMLTPGEGEALRIGDFRLAGEADHWMYERFSIARLSRVAAGVETFGYVTKENDCRVTADASPAQFEGRLVIASRMFRGGLALASRRHASAASRAR